MCTCVCCLCYYVTFVLLVGKKHCVLPYIVTVYIKPSVSLMPAHGMQTPGNHPVSQVRRGPEVLFKDLRRDEIRG